MVPDITIYIDPAAAETQQVREYMQRKRVPFYEHDVTRDVHAREYLRKINTSQVPVIRVGEEHVVGFDEARLDALIRTGDVNDRDAPPRRELAEEQPAEGAAP